MGTENVQNIFLVNHSTANHTDYWIIDSRGDLSTQNKYRPIDTNIDVDTTLVRMTGFWNNLHQVLSKSNDWKVK